jgi:RNA polymerase sigma-70 factor (ECF subfamily)
LEDPDVRTGLLDHARAVLRRLLAGRPPTVRLEAAEEAVQETQLRAIQKRHEYKPGEGSVRPWLHGIMNNALRETTRSFRRQPAQVPEDSAAWERLAADLALPGGESVRDRLALGGYLDRLRPEHRQILQLRFYEGLRPKEIAARLKISPENARVRLCRALEAMRALVGVSPEEEHP